MSRRAAKGCGAAGGRNAAASDGAAKARLGFVTNFFPSLTETFIYREIAGLARHGLPVVVYSVRCPPETDVSEEVRSLRSNTRYLLPPRYLVLAAAHLGWLARRPLRYLSTLALVLFGRHYRLRDRLRSLVHFTEGVLVARLAAADGVSHLHGHYASHPATIALAASRLLGVPFSFTGHAYDIWTDRLLLPQKLRACRFAVTCTASARLALLAEAAPGADPAKVRTVYHGVDVGRFTPGPRERGGTFEVLSVGRLDRQKGHHHLLAALARLQGEGHDWRLCIVGTGAGEVELRRLTRTLGLADRVRFAGRIYHEDLPDYYRRADLFVLACFNDAGNQDNLPNVLLEAMACGVPVVATRLQGIPELIEHGVSGLLVEQADLGEGGAGLAAAIRRIMTDHALAERLGRNGRRRVAEHFDLARSVEELAALYRGQLRAAGRHPGRAGLRVVTRFTAESSRRAGGAGGRP